ncbi:hypothetical protein CLCAR_1191 [Clostridium carboxidivorans P7]|nr:hypothetical protein CLCAR_1191 [Clostridium carboxidivorans P7]
MWTFIYINFKNYICVLNSNKISIENYDLQNCLTLSLMIAIYKEFSQK